MQGFKRAALAMVLAAGLQAVWSGAAIAQPKTGQCPQGTRGTVCLLWTGKVTFIGDGDTVSVDLHGDGTKKAVRVRMTGIQAMEETYYTNVPADRTGECHANEATARLEQIVARAKGRVQLAAQNPASHSGARLRRAVSVKIHGKWRDVGRMLVAGGHALFLSNGTEWAWNRSYNTLAQQAAPWGVNLWDPDYCGVGPPANLRLWANPEPEGLDEDGEWVKIRNLDPLKPLALGGWWVRDSALRRYVFPRTATVAPGATLTLWVGEGIGYPPTDFFWGSRRGVFDRVNADHSTGDGAYLFDPQGDLRASMTYPCRYNCTDPYKGAVKIRAKYRGSEYVTLQNRTSAPVDLENYRLASPPHSYVFGPDSTLQPGEEMRLEVRGAPESDSHGRKHWGQAGPILGNAGDKLVLTTLNYIRLGCYAWGRASC
jgi:endonuclease YncB( thermonuclease family)